MARRRCLRARGLVLGAPARRRRVELRLGRGFDCVVVPLDPERPEGPALLRVGHRGYRCYPRGAARRRGISVATKPVQTVIERGAGWALGVAVRLSIPLVLQGAERNRLLPRGVASRRSVTGSAYGGGDRADPCRPSAGRHLDPGTTTPRSRVVRGRRGSR